MLLVNILYLNNIIHENVVNSLFCILTKKKMDIIFEKSINYSQYNVINKKEQK